MPLDVAPLDMPLNVLRYFDFTKGALPQGATLTRNSQGWYFNQQQQLTSPTGSLTSTFSTPAR